MSGSRSRIFSFLTSERMEPSLLTSYVFATIVLAVLIQSAIRISQLIRRRFRDYRALKDFSGPKGHWLWGNLRQVLSHKYRMDYTKQLVKAYPDACVTRMTPFHYSLRAHHPDTIKAIASTPGQGLLISKGHQWARNRRLLTPAFHFDILKPYVSIFSQSAFTMIKKWRSLLKKNDQPLEMFEHVSLMTLDSLMKCIFGYQGDCQVEGVQHPYIQGVYAVAKLVSERFLFFPYHSDVIYHMTWSGYKFRRACRLVHTYSQEVIAQKRIQHAQSESKGVTSDERHIDFMDIILQAKDEDGRGLTDAEIQAEVDTFMFEGHDTTASGISWCLYNLARHPEYQAKCRDEVNSVLGDKEQFSWEDVHNLPFLTMCAKESLRLHPPVPVTGRETTKPLTFPDGRTIPAGIIVLISIFGCHHNPAVWENPEVYDPYRFTPENSKNRSSYAFVPFSAGPRNCIGQQFALHEIKVSVGQVLRHFELSEVTDKPPIVDPLLVLRAKEGLYVNVKPIEC